MESRVKLVVMTVVCSRLLELCTWKVVSVKALAEVELEAVHFDVALAVDPMFGMAEVRVSLDGGTVWDSL